MVTDIYHKVNFYSYSQDLADLESVTFSVGTVNDDIPETIANSDIKRTRMVYVDRHGTPDPEKGMFSAGAFLKDAIVQVTTLKLSKYSKFINNLATFLGILNPAQFFATDKVIQEKDYYIRDGAYRNVTKFVELNAPVSGKTQWYAWGYAESHYVRIGA